MIKNKQLMISLAVASILVVGIVFYTVSFLSAQAKHNFLISHPYGLDGRDIRHASHMEDVMASSISHHLNFMATQCDKYHVDPVERKQLIMATLKAGMDAEHEVANSQYTVPFNPHYPILPKN